MSILQALGAAAIEMTGGSSPQDTRTSQHADKASEEAKPCTRRLKRVPLENTFHTHVHSFFYPLVEGAFTKRDTWALLADEAMLMERWITVLAVIVIRARNAPMVLPFAETLLDVFHQRVLNSHRITSIPKRESFLDCTVAHALTLTLFLFADNLPAPVLELLDERLGKWTLWLCEVATQRGTGFSKETQQLAAGTLVRLKRGM